MFHLSHHWRLQYVPVAIESWLRLRTSLLVPMELLQPLEGGVLALVSCCDKKQVTHHTGIEQFTLSTKPTKQFYHIAHIVADPANSLLFVSRSAVSVARVGAAARHELQIHRHRVNAGYPCRVG